MGNSLTLLKGLIDTEETKYDYSMEKLITLIDTFCTFPAIEKVKLFRLTIFNFLVGNEDMHLKNFSLITRDNNVELSPAYDLLNTTIISLKAQEEIALPIGGKRRDIDRNILVDYFAKERLKLNDTIIAQVLNKINAEWTNWENLVTISFLSNEMKEKYFNLINKRKTVIQL
ncbi:MAG: HipA domain-containing protein [Ignavibacteriaceae bacterium]